MIVNVQTCVVLAAALWRSGGLLIHVERAD